MSDIKLKAASGGGSISLKGPSSAGSDTDFLDTSGNLNVTGNLTIPDKIIHDGDTNTAIRFPAADTITAETSGSERFRILSDGRMVQRYSTDPWGSRALTLQAPAGETATHLSLVNTETNGSCGILFGDHAGQNAGNFDGYILYSHQTTDMKFLTNGGTERFKIGSGGDVTVTDGNLVVASGHGIDFSATADGGGTSTTQELLDDYEEGTWTPVDASGGSVSYTDTAGNCKYTKIGRTVIASFTVTFLSTSNTSQAKIGGLPYACVGTTNNNASVAIGEHSDLHQITMLVNQGQSYMLVLACSSGVAVRQNNECSGKNYRGTAIYQTA